MRHDLIAEHIRPLDPEGAEKREFLAARVRRAQCEAARQKPGHLALGKTTEEGRALKARDFACVLGAPIAVEHAKAGEIEVGLGRRREPAELEARGIIGEPADRAVLDRVDGHGVLVDEAAMQGLDDKTPPFGVPDAILPMDMDRLVLLESEVAEVLRQIRVRRHVGSARQLPGDLDDRIRIEAFSLAEDRAQERGEFGLLRETRLWQQRAGERRERRLEQGAPRRAAKPGGGSLERVCVGFGHEMTKVASERLSN